MKPSPSFAVHRLFAASAVLLCFASPAWAQNDMTLAPSPALACLTIPGGAPLKPDYPADSLKRKEGGTVKVQMEFRAPDEKPRVTVLDRSKYDELDNTVESHVRQFRVPCMDPANGPLTLLQAYAFDPDGASRVMAGRARDAADIKKAEQIKCMRHRVPKSIPIYPKSALRQADQGNVIVKLHFAAQDKAPTVEFVGGTTNRSFRSSVADYAEDLRMPCVDDQPVDVLIAYKFVIDGGARFVLRDGGLAQVLGSAADLPHPSFFDFNTLACPFDVRLTYHRPFANNRVQQLDTAVPARQPFLDWLEGLTFKLSEDQNAKVFGNKMIITVPCGQLDI